MGKKPESDTPEKNPPEPQYSEVSIRVNKDGISLQGKAMTWPMVAFVTVVSLSVISIMFMQR